MLRWTAAALAALLTLVIACGSGERETSQAALPEPPASGAPPPAPAPEPETPLPALGEVNVFRLGSRFSVLANDAERIAVLRELERVGGFTLSLRADPGLASGVTLRVEAQPLEVAIALALAGVSHSVEYQAAQPGPGRVLARLVVGSPGASELRPGPQSLAERGAAEAFEERAPSGEQDALADLGSRSPAVRAEAVAELDVDTAEGFRAVAERLARDPDPSVRAAAAETLSEAGAGAVPPLLEALGDEDPRVVVAALDGLELVGDESLVPQLRPLLEHRDPEARARAAEAIEFLE